ncbi:hypothetical protein BDN72DRAFT_963374 [Pluteus cervinus]|uniref:Uncharacterized protein n=1 Tax=Pluteus cervinus TaxID=181527 RepID=A0ACD3AF14_9AGAR|nr:hypothetical protein BDN72DRAFT_963374 [Pluteus cervinus]
MSILPAELIENILEHVYSEYKDLETPSDLHRCALVSRTWRAISQPLIFFELLLSEGQEEQMKMLLDTHLRQHVRKAWIEDCGSLEFIEEFFNLLPNVQGLCVLHSGPRKLMETPVPETMLKNLTSLVAVEDPQLTTEYLLYSSALSNLRVVTISIIQEIKDYTSYIPWMKAFLSCLPVSNRLEEIHIPCLFTDPEDVHVDADMPLYGWEALDTILTSSEFRLKRVVFGIYGLGKPSRPEALRSLLRESLPGLNRNGILEIVGSTEYGYISEEDRWWYIKPVGIL